MIAQPLFAGGEVCADALQDEWMHSVMVSLLRMAENVPHSSGVLEWVVWQKLASSQDTGVPFCLASD
jgi:hypothetical protein